MQVKAFSGLLINFLKSEKTNIVLRGLRVVSDFEYEFQMALMNRRLDPDVETVFLTPKEELSYLSSRLVKEVHRLGGDVSGLVPPLVYRSLRKKLPNGPPRVLSGQPRENAVSAARIGSGAAVGLPVARSTKRWIVSPSTAREPSGRTTR